MRFTLTRHQRPEDIRALVQRARPPHTRRATGTAPTGAAGPTRPRRRAHAAHGLGVRTGLRLEHHRSIAALDQTEWDSLLGDRGSFTAEGLRLLERAFTRDGRPEDHWGFHYFIVRDAQARPVLATFFTDALSKDDMLSSRRGLGARRGTARG